VTDVTVNYSPFWVKSIPKKASKITITVEQPRASSDSHVHPSAATPRNILALDRRQRRVGVAIANSVACLPRPLATLLRGEHFWQELRTLLTQHEAHALVIGLRAGWTAKPRRKPPSSRCL